MPVLGIIFIVRAFHEAEIVKQNFGPVRIVLT